MQEVQTNEYVVQCEKSKSLISQTLQFFQELSTVDTRKVEVIRDIINSSTNITYNFGFNGMPFFSK